MIKSRCKTNQVFDTAAALNAIVSGKAKTETISMTVRTAKPTRAASPLRRIKRDEDIGDGSFRTKRGCSRLHPSGCARRGTAGVGLTPSDVQHHVHPCGAQPTGPGCRTSL